jgi:predicted DNA-binding transcriptional regulator AlpA
MAELYARGDIELAGNVEVAEILGVRPQRVYQLIKDSPTPFPEPIAELSRGSIWLRDEVVDWDKRRRRQNRAGGRHSTKNRSR